MVKTDSKKVSSKFSFSCTLLWAIPNSVKRITLLTTENYTEIALHKLKGYLYYKKITSQNVSVEAQVNNFSISKETYVRFSRY